MSTFTKKQIFSKGNGQRGAALIVGLIILLVLTMLGVIGMQTSILEERMASNMRDRDIALQAAEAAVREAEEFLQGAVLPVFNTPALGLYQPASPGTTPVWETVGWTTGTDVAGYSDTLVQVAQQPQYIIEELPPVTSSSPSLAADVPVPEDELYRITARGIGGSPNTDVIIQTHFRR